MVSRRLMPYALVALALVGVAVTYAGEYTHEMLVPRPDQITFREMWNLRCHNETGRELTVYLRGYLIHEGKTVVRGKSGNTVAIPSGTSDVRSERITSLQESYCAPGYEGFIERGEVPAGVYYACIAAYESSTNQLLDSNCVRVEPRRPGEVRLLTPRNQTVLPLTQIQPLFSWARPMPTPSGRDPYLLTIAEIMPGQTPEVAIKDNVPWFKKSLGTTNYKYGAGAKALDPNKKYAWQVNNSEVWSFSFEEGVTPPPPDTSLIQLVSPTGEKPPKSLKPTFQWKTKRLPKGVTFTLVVTQLPDSGGPDSGRVVLERSGIRGNSLRYPPDAPALDSTKVYGVQVMGVLDTAVVARSPVVFFSWWCCRLVAIPSSYSICTGGTVHLNAWAFMMHFPWGPCNGIHGSMNWTLTHVDDGSGVSQNGTMGSVSSASLSITPIPSPPPVPGVYHYTLTVTRGNCPKTVTFTVTVYPSVQSADIVQAGLSIQDHDACYNTEAQLVVPALPGAPPLMWYYQERDMTSSCSGWNPWPLTWTPWVGGNGVNTQPFGGCPRTCGRYQRRYKVEYGDPALINSSNAGCLRKILHPVTVYCDPVGTVSGPTNFCASTADFTLSVTGYYPGSTIQWTGGPTAPTWTLTGVGAGPHSYEVKIWNGPCGPLVLHHTVTVFLPLPDIDITYSTPPWTGYHVTGDHVSEVCPNDDAILGLSGLPAWLTNKKIQWQYDIDCTGTWTNFVPAVDNTSHNTNEIGNLGPYSPPPTTSLCWRAIITNLDYPGTDPDCQQTTTPTWRIKIIQKPCMPMLACTGGLPGLGCKKCAGSPVTLTATFASGCDATDYTYQWLYNGLPYAGDGATTTTISPTAPGYYSLIVYSKYKCLSVRSDTIGVRDCVFDLGIQGPSCAEPNASVTLTAVDQYGGTNFSSCGGPYAYLWSTGATTQSITVTPFPSPPPPPECGATVTYTVTVTDAPGCSKTAAKTILVCP